MVFFVLSSGNRHGTDYLGLASTNPTVSGEHWLGLGVFTINLIISSDHLLPEFITSYELNIIIIMMGETITMIVFSKGSRKTCTRYKWQERGMRSIITILEWMKSSIKFDTYLKLTSGRHSPHQTQK